MVYLMVEQQFAKYPWCQRTIRGIFEEVRKRRIHVQEVSELPGGAEERSCVLLVGASEEWINQRLQGKKERKKLTDEWQRAGVKEKQYAILTNAIYEVWSGMTAKEYKHFKGLKKENLRDNMTDTESALTTLAEVATREISQNEDPASLQHSINIAHRGGKVAKVAREALEEQLGRSIISPENAKTLNAPEEPRLIDDQTDE